MGKRKPTNLASAALIGEGLAVYFDKALLPMLLYSQEKEQYDEFLNENQSLRPRDIYGGEHLLRLFVRLPSLLSQSELTEDEAYALQTRLNEFCKFLVKNLSEYFTTEKGTTYFDTIIQVEEQ